MNKYIIKKEKEQIDIQASKQTKNKNHQYVRHGNLHLPQAF